VNDSAATLMTALTVHRGQPKDLVPGKITPAHMSPTWL